MVPASLVSYIETLSSGTLNLIKELNQYYLEEVCGADVYQDLTSLSTGVMSLKKNVGNNIESYFPDLWIAVNDLKRTFIKYGVQNKTPHFSTHDLIQVNYKGVH